jgi:hypothetical protein
VARTTLDGEGLPHAPVHVALGPLRGVTSASRARGRVQLAWTPKGPSLHGRQKGQACMDAKRAKLAWTPKGPSLHGRQKGQAFACTKSAREHPYRQRTCDRQYSRSWMNAGVVWAARWSGRAPPWVCSCRATRVLLKEVLAHIKRNGVAWRASGIGGAHAVSRWLRASCRHAAGAVGRLARAVK